MTTARPPKVTESAIQVEAANEQAGRQPHVPLKPNGDDQGQSAEEPTDCAEMQEPRHEPPDRSGDPLVREKKLLKRFDHKPLDQNAVNHRDAAADDPGHCQGCVLPIHNHTPLHGT
jgi:hypothetical protein